MHVVAASDRREDAATTVSIRIVADCGALPCQVTQKLERATTLEFTTESAIIFIHCYALFTVNLLFLRKSFSN